MKSWKSAKCWNWPTKWEAEYVEQKKKKKKKKAKLQIDIGHVCRSFLLIGYSVLTDELTFL